MLLKAKIVCRKPSWLKAIRNVEKHERINLFFDDFLNIDDGRLYEVCKANIKKLKEWISKKLGFTYFSDVYQRLFVKPYCEFREDGLDFKLQVYQYLVVKFMHDGKQKFAVGIFKIKSHTPSITQNTPIPLSLLNCLVENKFETAGFQIVESTSEHLTYQLKNNVRLKIPKKLVEWIQATLKPNPVERLREMDFLDPLTYEVLRSKTDKAKSLGDVGKLLSLIEPKDVEKLKIIKTVDEALSYGKWAILLKISRTGVYRWFKRMTGLGLLKTEKTDKGVKVELSGKGKMLLNM